MTFREFILGCALALALAMWGVAKVDLARTRHQVEQLAQRSAQPMEAPGE